MIDYHIFLNGNRHTGVIIGAAQIVAEQSFGNVRRRNTPIGEQGGYVEDLHFLIYGCIIGNGSTGIVELRMSDLVNGSTHRLYFAHSFPNRNALICQT